MLSFKDTYIFYNELNLVNYVGLLRGDGESIMNNYSNY
jgi:hypothetical protein